MDYGFQLRLILAIFAIAVLSGLLLMDNRARRQRKLGASEESKSSTLAQKAKDSVAMPPHEPPTMVHFEPAELVRLERLADELVEICDQIYDRLERADGSSRDRDFYPVIDDLARLSGLISAAHSAEHARLPSDGAEKVRSRASQAA